MGNEARFYFAYGSNMDSRQMTSRCGEASVVGPARLQSFEFRINGRGVATIVRNDRSHVYGMLWRISESDERSLDDYEGVKYGTYNKQSLGVEAGTGATYWALVYIAADSRTGVPRPGYLERIVAAARQHRLPPEYVETLQQWAGQ